jgi:hypothetical protein
LRDEQPQPRFELDTDGLITREGGVRRKHAGSGARGRAAGEEPSDASYKRIHNVIQLYHCSMARRKGSAGRVTRNTTILVPELPF